MKRVLFLMIIIAGVMYGEATTLSPLPFKYGERFSLRIYILGQYVGNYYMRLDGRTNINGMVYFMAHGRILTREDLRHLYDMDDRDVTIFDPQRLLPVYNERFVKEGKWEDHIRHYFFIEEKRCEYYHKTRNYQRNELKAELPVMEYSTLLLYFRALDYDKLDPKEEVRVSYKHRDEVYTTSFSYRKITVSYKGKKVPAIQVKETGGLGIYFTMLDDENRTPYEIRIAAFYIVGFRFVDLKVTINNYQSGTSLL